MSYLGTSANGAEWAELKIPNASSAAGFFALTGWFLAWCGAVFKYAAYALILISNSLDFLLTILKYAILSLGVVMRWARLGNLTPTSRCCKQLALLVLP